MSSKYHNGKIDDFLNIERNKQVTKPQLKFYIPINYNNQADILLTVGLAKLLSFLSKDSVLIKNFGSYYQVSSSKEVDFSKIKFIHPCFKFVVKEIKSETKDDVKEIWEKVNDKLSLVDQRKEKKKLLDLRKEHKKLTEEMKASINIDPFFTTINFIRINPNWNADATLFVKIYNNNDFVKSAVKSYLSFYSSFNGKKTLKFQSELDKEFNKEVTPTLFINPQYVKGYNKPKAGGIARGSFKREIIWFEEWMKIIGVEQCLLARQNVKGPKDRRIFTIIPNEISLDVLTDIHRELELSSLFSSTVKIEIIASLNLNKILISHSREYKEFNNSGDEDDLFGFSFAGKNLDDVIAGLSVGYYKDMGMVKSPTSNFILSCPNWYIISNKIEANEIYEIMNEFLKIIYSLDDNNSNDLNLLLLFRDFLSSNNEKHFFYFISSFAHILMSKIINKKLFSMFSINTLNKMFTGGFNMTYTEIIQNPGFINISNAIRKATVSRQLEKRFTGKSKYEIYYGLSQDWKNVVQIPNLFINKLTEFVQRYNAENARKAEENKNYRALITTEDLAQVIKLIDDHGSENVGMLLLAFGYSRSPKDRFKEEDKNIEENPIESEEDEGDSDDDSSDDED